LSVSLLIKGFDNIKLITGESCGSAATMVLHTVSKNEKIKHEIVVCESSVSKELVPVEKNQLNPYVITGFSDGEGTFVIRLRSSSTAKFGFYISAVYTVSAQINPENKKLLECRIN
jgi:hypothetical protein